MIDVIDVTDVSPASPVSPVSLAHLWVLFGVICIGEFQTGSRRRSHPFGYGGGSGSNFEEEGGMFERRGGPVKRR